MKRALWWSATLLVSFGVVGCPVYSDIPDGCLDDSDCGRGFACDNAAGMCVRMDESGRCDAPSDCAPNETCGRDNRCYPGSCYFHHCVAGYECREFSGWWTCEPSGTSTPIDSGAPPPVDAGRGVDAGADSSPEDASSAGDAATGGDGGASEENDAGADDAGLRDAAPDARRVPPRVDASARDAQSSG